MTREALNKLNSNQMKYCVTMSAIIDRDRKAGAKKQYERNSGKLRGFLECLMLMEIIRVHEMKALYLWFHTENREKNEAKESKENE